MRKSSLGSFLGQRTVEMWFEGVLSGGADMGGFDSLKVTRSASEAGIQPQVQTGRMPLDWSSCVASAGTAQNKTDPTCILQIIVQRTECDQSQS